MNTYIFRREDNGELISVDFETMMGMDSLGYITLQDGIQARRSRAAEIGIEVQSQDRKELEKPIVSDSLGFGAQQLAEFEADRVRHGFTGIEFTNDPLVPEFIQVRCNSKVEWQRYLKHRGMSDFNSRNGSGATLTQEQMDEAKKRILEKYPLPA